MGDFGKELAISLIVIAIFIAVASFLGGYIYSNVAINYQMSQEIVGEGIKKSLSTTDVKYIEQSNYQLTNGDGTPAPLHIVKFECCGVGGMIKNGEIYIGTTNERLARPVFATTSQMIPEIEMAIIIHELTHYSTKHFATSSKLIDVNDRVWQENVAYNSEWLYRQMMMFDEDNYFRIVK